MTENPDKNSRIITDTPNIDNSISNNSILNPFPDILPVLPLKDIVIFPYMIFPVLAGRESTIKSINNSVESNNLIFLVSQIDSTIEEPVINNLFRTGTVAKILQVLRLPNGLIKVLVDGLFIASAIDYHSDQFISANIKIKQTEYQEDNELKALENRSIKLFTDYVNTNHIIPKETLIEFQNLKESDRKLFYIASTLNIGVSRKQLILEKKDIKEQYFEILYILNSEIEILNIEKDIDSRIFQAMQKNQRKFIVQEQIRILQEELDEGFELDPDLIKLREQIEKSGMPENILQKASDEFNKLRKTPTISPDFGVIRNYLDWMVSVPWNKFTEDNYDLEKSKFILDEDHYDLEKPKERIIELIAVLKLLKEKNINKTPKGQILCLVGPPGVGKTSLGKSIARTLNRKFTRISVGGVKDEAEIRGHRRTYIGAMPGKIIQAMKKAGTSNPVILIDEIDKMSNDFRGDPSSAMLEVLDPEQNNTFNDHYLDVDYDLSKVLFITTANIRYNIPLPLQDRMEIIEMRSYLDFEKVQIALKHIIPKVLIEHGMDNTEINFTDDAILKIIHDYTKEAGVRNLEREISSIIRKIAKSKVQNINLKQRKFLINAKKIGEYLGVTRYFSRKRIKGEKNKIGSVYGLAWTSLGGDILNIDVTVMKGENKLILTGQLGDVMKESALAGLSYIKSNSKKFKIPDNYFKDKEIHIHLPEGAIPKDGPSAGITMIIAMLSAVTGNAIYSDVAMTGEITLRGDVLAVGGLNEKLLAAQRNEIKTILIPKDNGKDLSEVPDEIKKNLDIILIDNVNNALEYAFVNKKVIFNNQ